MAVWSAAADALDRRLAVQLLPRERPPGRDTALAVRCHQVVCAAGRQGGWSAVTVIERHIDQDTIETVLDRGPERVVIHVWDVVGDVDHRIGALMASIAQRASDGGHPIVGLAVVPASIGNRRRMTEARESLDATLPTLAAHWYAALHNPARPAPTVSGVLWMDRTGERLSPAPLVPGWAWVTPDHGSRALTRSAR